MEELADERREAEPEEVAAEERVEVPAEEERVTVEGALDTLEERVVAPERTDELRLRVPAEALVRGTLLREAEELRAKLLWEAAPRAEKLPSR